LDLNQQFGGDLQISATGDLALVDGDNEVQQRILRRLLTNLKAYLWHLDYGAGLAGFVGTTTDSAAIQGAVISQLQLEDGVAKSPNPMVTVTLAPSQVFCDLQYWDAVSSQPKTLSFNAIV